MFKIWYFEWGPDNKFHWKNKNQLIATVNFNPAFRENSIKNILGAEKWGFPLWYHFVYT